jgi:predicted TIM-barrel fold metal-dependent hydrolase
MSVPATETAFRIFDMHEHIGSLDAGDGKGDGSAMSYEDDYAMRSAALDQFGFEAAIAMPSLQYARPRGYDDTLALNDAIAAYRTRYGKRFPVALGTVEPNQGVDLAVREIGRIANVLELDGIVWHHRFQGAFLGDRRMHPLLEACAEHKLPAFFHVIADSNMEAPWLLEELYHAHPDVQFVALDPLSGLTQIRYIMAMAERCPKLLFDTAFAVPIGRAIEEFVDRFGSERLLFGTDMYLSPPLYVYPHVLREILAAPTLTDAHRRDIFWNNAERLFPAAFARRAALPALL